MVLAPSEFILKACSESLTHNETLYPFDAAKFARTVPKLPPPRTATLLEFSMTYKVVALNICTMAIAIITTVLNTLRLCNHLKRLSQPLSLALFVSGIIMYPKKEKNTATIAI